MLQPLFKLRTASAIAVTLTLSPALSANPLTDAAEPLWVYQDAHSGWSFQLDPNATVTAGNHLSTNIPSTALGSSNVGTNIGADRFYNAGISGQGTVTANVEAGHISNTHEALTHVSSYSHSGSAFNDPNNGLSQQQDLVDRHATWVGTHIGGREVATNPQVRQSGIAPDTDLRSGAIASNWNGNAYAAGFGLNVASFVAPYDASFGSSDVINSSWGGTDPGGGNAFAVALDGFANQNPNTSFVTSAGNSGPSTNTVGWPGSGYNSITVAALQNDGSNRYQSLASFSSRGPQDYFDPDNGTIGGVRAAVDIAAPGTNLTAGYHGGQTGGNNATLPGSPSGPAGAANSYSSNLAGTSFASPITAGAAALVDSASYNTPTLAGNARSRDARVVKAVLLNSADKIPGWDNGQTAHANGLGGVATSQSLDWNSGAGALNLDQAFTQYLDGGTRDLAGLGGGTIDVIGWDFGEIGLGQTSTYVFADTLLGGSTLTVTLDWFRERAFDVANLIVSEIAQANLDLLIRDRVSGDLISESVSLFNVVEHLSYVLPGTSSYQLEVVYTDNSFGSATTTAFGLAWAGVAGPSPAQAPAPGTPLLLLLAGLTLADRRARRTRRTASIGTTG